MSCKVSHHPSSRSSLNRAPPFKVKSQSRTTLQGQVSIAHHPSSFQVSEFYLSVTRKYCFPTSFDNNQNPSKKTKSALYKACIPAAQSNTKNCPKALIEGVSEATGLQGVKHCIGLLQIELSTILAQSVQGAQRLQTGFVQRKAVSGTVRTAMARLLLLNKQIESHDASFLVEAYWHIGVRARRKTLLVRQTIESTNILALTRTCPLQDLSTVQDLLALGIVLCRKLQNTVDLTKHACHVEMSLGWSTKPCPVRTA